MTNDELGPRRTVRFGVVAHEDPPSGQGPVGDLVGVCVGQGFSDLADELDTGIKAQSRNLDRCPQVEAFLVLGPIEQQRRATLSLDQVQRLGDAVVTEALDDLELPLRLPAKTCLFLGRGGEPGEVDPGATRCAHPGSCSSEILPTGTFVDQLTQLPVTHPPATVPGFQPGLLDRLGDLGRHGTVD
jgi:hypothetical protein